MNAVIIPTGSEILTGIVQDTSSPYIIKKLVKYFPDCDVIRTCPVDDEKELIINKIDLYANNGTDLVIVTGGSGGGHKYNSALAYDYTHIALSEYLSNYKSRSIYGGNGHLWCRLICGFKNKCLIINLPGPFYEAAAAFDAFLEVYKNNDADIEKINFNMINAVLNQYPGKDGVCHGRIL